MNDGFDIVTDSSHYPRVLVIDPTPFNWHHNNGIVKSNLFCGWPKQNLAQIDYSNTAPEFDVCEKYWQLTKTDILRGMFGLATNREVQKPERPEGSIYDPRKANEYEARPALERRIGSMLSERVRTPVSEIILRLPSVLSPPLRKWIEAFRPEAIYSITASGPMLRLVHNICKLLDIPAILYFTDDWVRTLYKDVWLGSILRRSMLHWFRRCLDVSPIRFTPNDAMRDEYNRRYGGGFETMLYPQRITEVAEERAKPSGEDGVLRLLYVGGLAPNRFLALADIGRALEALKEYSIRARLTIYSFPEDIRAHGPFLVSNPCIEIGGTAQAEDVPKLLRGADVLVHVESFDSKSSEYTRYSLSTKITQYLMSGVCCLAYGPGEGASIRYVAESGGGVAVGAKDFEQLRATLRDLLESPSKRALLGRAGRRFAIEHHDVTKLRERFRQAFVRACEARRPYLAPIAGLSGL